VPAGPARRGAELQEKARGCRFRPGATGEGKAGGANTSEPLMMSCHSSSPAGCTGVTGAGRWEAAGGDRGSWDGRVDTAAPGIQRAPSPAESHACGTSKPRLGPCCWSGTVVAAGHRPSDSHQLSRPRREPAQPTMTTPRLVHASCQRGQQARQSRATGVSTATPARLA
jgi:hypothetical protein